MTKFWMVTKLGPTILKMASVSAPLVNAALAVMVLLLPVIVTVRDPILLVAAVKFIVYPPAGAVCGLPAFSVMMIGPEMVVTAFNAVMALASDVYVAASAGVALAGLVTVTWAIPNRQLHVNVSNITNFFK